MYKRQLCKTALDLDANVARVSNSYTRSKTKSLSSGSYTCSTTLTVNYNTDSQTSDACKSIDQHNPSVTVTHGADSGTVGLFADGENGNSWTKNSECLTGSNLNLGTLSCSGSNWDVEDINLGSSDSDLCVETTPTSCSSLTYTNFPW